MIAGDEDYVVLSRAAHEWRARVHSEDATDIDLKAFEAWLAEDIRHEEAYDRAMTFWAAYDHLRPGDIDADLMPPPAPVRQATLFDKARAMVVQTPFRMAAVAAIILAIAAPLTLVLTLRDGADPIVSVPVVATYSTGTAETRVITLHDGTVATLGALTQIETTMSDGKRAVLLKSGAALFDVAPEASRPFAVTAGDLTATALGTAFDVRNNGGVYRVAVAEGRVEVAYPHFISGAPSALTIRRTLTVGQEVAAMRGTGLRAIRNVPVDEIAAWRNEKLIYDGATLGELVADANRYSDRDIVLSDGTQAIAAQTITASFDAGNIDRMLRMVVLSYPIEIDRSDPEVVRIRARGDTGE